ncbi:7-carboxy-7-deazaguanine synthase QueE [Paraburkholderia sp. BR10923]|uniref:7-carboxy-7-deazaguanine synthase QueE n=1 Tax=Paraburkholderia sp. BR10923 TaxID=3236992 RepID=UPI0034CD2509
MQCNVHGLSHVAAHWFPVNETFDSLQGEGGFTGTPALFIRMQGCDVGCPWCDTKHTWPRDEARLVSQGEVKAKTALAEGSWAWFDVEQLADVAHDSAARHIVITGGEPCQYDLRQLIGRLQKTGKRVQVETSGTYTPYVGRTAFLTVSPKYHMPGGRKVLERALERADEFKFPVGKRSDIETVLERLQPYSERHGTPIWLQPLSESRTATELCIEAAHRYGWRVSLQTHKFINIR